MSKERYYLDFDSNYILSHLAKTVLQYNEYVVKIYQKCTLLFDAYSSNHLLDRVKLNSQSVVSNCMLSSNSSSKESKVSENCEATKLATATSVKRMSNVSNLQQIRSPTDSAGNEELQDVAVIPDKLFSPVRVEIEFDTLKKPNLSAISPQNEESSRCTEKRTPIHVNKTTAETVKFPSKLSQLGHTEMNKTEPFNPVTLFPARLQTVTVTPRKIGKAVSNSKSEADRKYLNPDTFLFKSMPRLIKSPRGLEIEIYTSSQRPENTISTTTPVSLIRSKITKPVADENIDKERSTKNVNLYEPKPGCSGDISSSVNLSVNEPKPGYSRDISSLSFLSVNEPKPGFLRDISSSAKNSVSSSQQFATNADSSIGADVDLGKDHLSYKSPEGRPTAKIFANLSPPSTEILIDCINQLGNIITMREGYMQSNYNSLIGFQKCLGYLIIQIENILNVVNHIQMLFKYWISENLIRNINGLITMSVILINNLVSMKLDTKKYIKLWSNCFKEYKHIKRETGPLLINGKPSVNFDVLHKYEDNLKAKWEIIDNTIPILESRISLFLSTADDFEKCINLFVKCLINVGVLKLSLTPAL